MINFTWFFILYFSSFFYNQLMDYPNITVEISTKNRLESLSHCLVSILNQSFVHKITELIIFMDGDFVDLRQNYLYLNILKTLLAKNIDWKILPGRNKGQHFNHQKALEISKNNWVWRLDDDNVAEYNVLETLIKHTLDQKVGIIGSLVYVPDPGFFPSSIISPKIEDSTFKYAVQLSKFVGIKETEHLHNTFLIRKEAGLKFGYNLNLSSVAHREETLFTYQIFRAGYKLIVDGNCITNHFKNPQGGIRSFNNPGLYQADENIYFSKLKEWGIILNKYLPIVINGGIGDNFCFKHILKNIKEKYKGKKKIIIATVYPDCYFDEPEIETTSIFGAQILVGDISRFDPYKIGFDNQGKLSLLECFKKIYL